MLVGDKAVEHVLEQRVKDTNLLWKGKWEEVGEVSVASTERHRSGKCY